LFSSGYILRAAISELGEVNGEDYPKCEAEFGRSGADVSKISKVRWMLEKCIVTREWRVSELLNPVTHWTYKVLCSTRCYAFAQLLQSRRNDTGWLADRCKRLSEATLASNIAKCEEFAADAWKLAANFLVRKADDQSIWVDFARFSGAPR
jgi:hypothetical protein